MLIGSRQRGPLATNLDLSLKLKGKLPLVFFHKDHLLDPDGVNAGAEMATLSLARTFVALGHEVFIAAQLPKGFLSRTTSRNGISLDGITYLDLTETYETDLGFEKLKNEYSLRAYHLVVASRAQALLDSRRRPEVMSRLLISHEPSPGGLGIQPKIAGTIADTIVCVSDAQKQGLVQAGCEANKIAVIPNGVDLELFTAGDPWKRDYKRLLFVGALVVDKGAHLLIDAFCSLKKKYSELTLDIYGSARLWGREDFFDTQHAQTLPGVTLHGEVSQGEIAKHFQTAGLLVLPSIYFDSFPLTAVEAQACGLPVLGSVYGGMREIIRDGVTGKLLGDLTVSSLADAIEELIKDVSVLQKMSQASLDHVRGKFSWKRTAMEILSLLDRIVQTKENLKRSQRIPEEPKKGEKEQGHTRSSSFPAQSLTDKRQAVNARLQEQKIGFLTTFDQRCGLATYAEYLLEKLYHTNIVVFAEDVDKQAILREQHNSSSEKNSSPRPIIRCWKRGDHNVLHLDAVIERERIGLLHLNCHYRFFDGSSFASLLEKHRKRGLKVIAHIHNPYTLDSNLQGLIRAVDCVIVHTPENKIEVLANGATPSQVRVVEHGIKVHPGPDFRASRNRLSIPELQKTVLCFGFIQPHKGIDEVIHAIFQLQAKYRDLHLYIVGEPHEEDPNALEYRNQLESIILRSGLTDFVHFSAGFVSEAMGDDYLTAADVVVFNYRSQYFEASGATARALGCGAAIIASCSPSLARLGDTVFHTTSGYPLPLALDLVLGNPDLNSILRANAHAWAQKYSWENIGAEIEDIYGELLEGQEVIGKHVEQQVVLNPLRPIVHAQNAEKQMEGEREEKSRQRRKSSPLKVLIQNRSNAYINSGGDTVLMQRLAQGLERRAVKVSIDLQGKEDPQYYDLVHLFNFATPDITQKFAKRCTASRRPFVVSALHEDRPLFYNQMITWFEVLRRYIHSGQPQDAWDEYVVEAKKSQPCPPTQNSWTAQEADVLLVTGERERQNLRRDYPDAGAIEICHLGADLAQSEPGTTPDDGKLFREAVGVSEFILCVARLETRKNQLMLLKALEESDLTVVFVTGGFTYQPPYEEACRAIRRKGKTIFLGRIEEDLLRSAYRASRVHVLPSWYELPGLVSLEAACLGTNVVVTENGTARDYFDEYAYYCKPEDVQSMYNAVMAAYYAPTRRGLSERVSCYTWENMVTQILEIYEKVRESTVGEKYGLLSTKQEPIEAANRPGAVEQVVQGVELAASRTMKASDSVALIPSVVSTRTRDRGTEDFAQSLCDEGDALAKSSEFGQAIAKYQQALCVSTQCIRAHRSCGVMALQRKDLAQAEKHFRTAEQLDPADTNTATALGALQWEKGKREEAFQMFLDVLRRDRNHLSALFHLINAAYILGKFIELENALQAFLKDNPKNFHIGYCLAGCYYQQGKIASAKTVLEHLLRADPGSVEANELKRLIDEDTLPKSQYLSGREMKEGRTQDVKTSSIPPQAAFPQDSFPLSAKDSIIQGDPFEECLRELEKAKELQNYDKVISRVDELLSHSQGVHTDAGQKMSDDQQTLARLLKAEALACSGDLVKAEGEFRIAEQNKVYRYRALTGQGAVAAALERWDEAEAFFRQSLELFSKDDIAVTGLGITSMKKGNALLAWDYFQKALSMNQENMRALLGVIQLGYSLNQLPALKIAIENYLDMHPANLSILYAHAGCCYALGKMDLALEELDKIRIFEPDHKLANELLAKIRGEEHAVRGKNISSA